MSCMDEIEKSLRGASFVQGMTPVDGGIYISTWFTIADGEELAVVLEERNGRCILTDRRHMMGWLCNNGIEMTESRMSVLEQTMRDCFTRYDEGEIVREIGEDPVWELSTFMTALIRTSDIIYLGRRTVRRTFLDDVKGMFEERFPDCETGKILSTDKGERFRVDVYIDRDRPLLVFGVRTKDRCKDASLAIMALSDDMEFDSLAIVDDGADIPKRDLEFLRNRAGSVMTLDEARGAEF